MADRKQAGRLLFAHLEAQWDAAGKTRNRWCHERGLNPVTVGNWARGVGPSDDNIREVAEKTGENYTDLLLLTGLLSEQEAVASKRLRELWDTAAGSPAPVAPVERRGGGGGRRARGAC